MKNAVKQRNPKHTREQLVKAAANLIRKRGLARVTTREIAREAGYAEGTLYKHFENKEDLFLAVVLESLPPFESALDPAITGQTGVAENLQNIAMAAIQFFEKVLPNGVALLADSALLGRHRKRLRRKNGGPRVLFETVAEYILTEQARGRINRALDPLSAAAVLLGPCFQWVLTRIINGRSPLELTDKQFTGQLVETVLRGFSPGHGTR